MSRYLKLTFVGLGASASFLDSSVNVAFPAIARRFSLDEADILWLVVSFSLTSICLMLRCGRLGDRIGHRFVFRFGLAWSVVAFAADALAPSYAHLMLARICQGVGAAAIVSCGLALARDLFDPSERTKVIGYYVLMISFAGALGPVAGGLVIDWLGWSGVFSFRVAIAAAAWLLTLALPRGAQAGAGQLLAATVAVAAVALALTIVFRSDGGGWLFGTVLAMLAGLAVLGAADLLKLLRAGRALFDGVGRTAFAGFVGAIFRAIATHSSAFAVMLLVPFYLRDFRQLDSSIAGVSLAFFPLGIATASALTGRALARVDGRWFGIAAMSLVAAALWTIRGWSAEIELPYVCLCLFAAGSGLGAFHVAYGDYITGVYGIAQRGVAGALIEFSRTVGIMLAALTLFPLFQYLRSLAQAATPAAAFHAGFGATFAAAAAVPAALILATALWRLLTRTHQAAG